MQYGVRTIALKVSLGSHYYWTPNPKIILGILGILGRECPDLAKKLHRGHDMTTSQKTAYWSPGVPEPGVWGFRTLTGSENA